MSTGVCACVKPSAEVPFLRYVIALPCTINPRVIALDIGALNLLVGMFRHSKLVALSKATAPSACISLIDSTRAFILAVSVPSYIVQQSCC